MPKKLNQEASYEGKPVITDELVDQQEINNGEVGFVPAYDANNESISVPEQSNTHDQKGTSDSPPNDPRPNDLAQNDPAQNSGSAYSAQRPNNRQQNGYAYNKQQENSGTQSDSNGSGRFDYKNWGQTMQTQADSRQGQQGMNSAEMNSSPFGKSTQPGFNYGQLLTLGDAKRWFSLLGGAYLAIYGLRRSLGSLTVVSAGLGLIYYAMTGRWPLANRNNERQANQGGRAVSGTNPLSAMRLNSDSITTKNIIVKAPLNQVYQAWADFEKFPHFMHYIKSVNKTGERTSHWVMEGPLNTHIEWDAETTRLEENKRIAWSSINGDIKTSGQVTFNPLPSNEVEVTVMLKYVPPAGLAGEIAAELFDNPEGKLSEDLRNFKRYIEAKEPQPV